MPQFRTEIPRNKLKTVPSRQSTVSCEAYSDAKVDEDFIPLMRANPYSYLFTSTVRFVYGLEHKLTPPPKMPKLVWKNSTMTPRVVRKLLSNSHFEIIESGKSWIGYFGKHLKGQNYRKMKQGQKVNHFPGCFVLGRKGESSPPKIARKIFSRSIMENDISFYCKIRSFSIWFHSNNLYSST